MGLLKTRQFEMTDPGELSYFLGIEFMKTSRGIIMHQRKYITETLKKFHMQNCNSVAVPVEANLKIDNSESEQNVDATLYRQIIGCLRFICHSRPEISYGGGVISKAISPSSSQEDHEIPKGDKKLWYFVSKSENEG